MIERIPSGIRTKRGFVILLVTSAAVFGAGFGYVLPTLSDSGSPDEALDEEGLETTVSTATETDAMDEATDRSPTEATAESEDRISAPEAPNRATKRPEKTSEETRRTTEAEATTTESASTDHDSERDSSNDGRPSGEARSEVNVTIGSLTDHPSNSRTLNAVVNAPTTASTAGGA